MSVNLEAPDPAFAGKKKPDEDLSELIEWARAQLGLTRDRPWKLISSRTKLKKILFEVEESGPEGTSRIIAKASHSDRSRGAYQALNQMWQAGFRPPSLYTVARPIAYLEERRLLLQEKAPGVQLLDSIKRADSATEELTRRAAKWLVALHGAPVVATPFEGEPDVVARCRKELAAALPDASRRIHKIAERMLELLSARGPRDRVPCHGDFHPMNIFLSDGGRVTVIDFDMFSTRERAADVAYFLAQTAILGYLSSGGFHSTANARRAFLREYDSASRFRQKRERLGLYIALAFLQSLHFELAILHTGNHTLVEPWLGSAERCLDGSIDLE